MKRYIEILIKIIENRNLIPKFSSILLSVILWAYISSEKSGDVKFRLPVTYAGLQESYVISKLSHKLVSVEVRGDKDELKNVSSKNIKLFVDLSKTEPGDHKYYTIQYQKIDLTDDFKVELYPEELKVLVEKKITRNIKVIPRYSGYPEKGFMIGKIKINPEYVKISGPESVVNNAGVAYTEMIPVDNKNAAFQQDIKIEKTAEDGLEYSISKVNVSIPVINNAANTVYEIPVVIRNRKKGYNYLISTNKVKISVILSDNKSITERSFSAYINAEEIDIDNDELSRKGRMDVVGFIHVDGDTPESDNGILSTNPDRIEIVVTKE